MNSIRQVHELNKRELENGVSPEASWHSDYRDTAYIYIGGLPFQLSEGDIITIFSQYGEPTFVNLVRDKETGESKGFAFLKYEDQRSTDLAVDNLSGTKIMNRSLRVDHTRYKKRDEDPGEKLNLGGSSGRSIIDDDVDSNKPKSETERLISKEERELLAVMEEHDDDDPMKDFLIREKKKKISAKKLLDPNESKIHRGRRERHHRSHNSSRSYSPRERSHNSYNNRAKERTRHDGHRTTRKDLEDKRTNGFEDEF